MQDEVTVGEDFFRRNDEYVQKALEWARAYRALPFYKRAYIWLRRRKQIALLKRRLAIGLAHQQAHLQYQALKEAWSTWARERGK